MSASFWWQICSKCRLAETVTPCLLLQVCVHDSAIIVELLHTPVAAKYLIFMGVVAGGLPDGRRPLERGDNRPILPLRDVTDSLCRIYIAY